ncbi:hypothetical protein TNCV_1611771 [Trichonephila clavipes]|nr:hypothetical protein TNCV_1611771 [Trichonephila clavipes]
MNPLVVFCIPELSSHFQEKGNEPRRRPKTSVKNDAPKAWVKTNPTASIILPVRDCNTGIPNTGYLLATKEMPCRRIRAPYKQLSEFEGGRIIGLKEAGWPNWRIARHMGRSDAPIRRMLARMSGQWQISAS